MVCGPLEFFQAKMPLENDDDDDEGGLKNFCCMDLYYNSTEMEQK